MAATNINLGCGPVFVDSPDWINLDFTPATPRVRRANLLARLPLPSDEARLVYASHFLEHIPKSEIDAFLRECHRVLQPGGVLRLVLPDLQEMATSYLHYREAGDHERADFLVLEIIDQCVRRESGGELGRIYRRLRNEPHPDQAELIAFVRERTGEALITSMNGQTKNPGGGGIPQPSRAWVDCLGGCTTGSSGSGYAPGWRHCQPPSARRTSVWPVSASVITGSGTSTSCNERSKRRASGWFNAVRPTAAQSRISPSIRSTSTPMVAHARAPSRCMWRRASPTSGLRRCAHMGRAQ
ncbi:class I SAM-dependent methyltransferase [Pseudohaliea rubra]|uniref:class I SAM-dependent methyltransferase n=1 Tax=Pseudohaliea rubra TaxID=475795 RepID=UPI0009FDDEAE|nr:methyltransferase domain-containing protein [Pseudohaliea rubra]